MDIFNNQFMLYYYLPSINAGVVIFLENNNVDINYYCYSCNLDSDIHYILTSSTTKRKNNAKRKIIIKCVDNESNNIQVSDDEIIVQYDGIKITVGACYIVDDIVLNTYIPDNYHIRLGYNSRIYDKNINELLIKDITCDYSINYRIFLMLANLESVTIKISNKDDIKIITDSFPNSVKNLSIVSAHESLPHYYQTPQSIEKLYLGIRNNLEKNFLPNSLKVLTLDKYLK
jgi:hypothetical protein